MNDTNEIVDMMVSEGESAGVHRQPLDQPQQITKQGWTNRYVDPTRQPIHILIYDAINGVGGFAGNIDPETDLCDGTYSYVDPMSTELQWANRVKQTKYYNYAQRTYASMVNPVFSQGNIATFTRFNGESKDDPIMDKWINNCDGTGTSYTAMQKLALINLRSHDVAYYSMTKAKNADLPSLGVYRAIDIIRAQGNDDGVLDDIMIFRGNETVIDDGGNAKTYTYARQYFMRGGECFIQTWRADNEDKNCGLGDWSNIDFEKFEEERATGVREMVVKADLPVASPIGEFVPTNPTSKTIIDACLGIFQDESKMNWLFALHNLPTPVIWGSNIKGMLGGAGQAIVQETNDPNQGYAPVPQYMSVDSSLLTGSMEKLKFNLERLRELAKENGVDTVTGAQAQSGDSKRYEFQATEQKLRGSVDMLRDGMDLWVFHMFNILTARSDAYQYERTYPASFYPEEEATLTELSEAVIVMNDMGLGATRNIIALQYARKILGRSLDKEDEKIIMDEVERSVIEVSNNGE